MADSAASKPTTDPKAILQRLRAETTPTALIFVSCPDSARRRRVVDACAQAVSREALQPEKVLISGAALDTGKINSLRSSCLNLSLFSKQRIFIFTDAGNAEIEVQKQLLAILEESPAATTFLIGSSNAPSTSPLVKRAKQLDSLLSFEKLEGAQLIAWIKKELGQSGLSDFEAQVPATLAQIGEESPDGILRMIEQLSLFLDGSTLKTSHVLTLFQGRGEASEFDLLEALARGKYLDAELLLHRLFVLGKSPFAFLALLQKMFTTYLGVALRLKAGQSEQAIAAQMDLKPWLAHKYATSVRSMSPARLRRALQTLTQAEAKLKNKSLGAELVCSEACRLIALR